MVCHNVKLTTTVPKVGITKLIANKAAHPASDAYLKGGELQEWDPEGGKTYTYTVGGTAAKTKYYIYAYAKGAVSSIELTYNPAK